MRHVTVAVLAAGAILLGTGAANAQAPDKRGFNFNVAGCPTSAAGLQTVNYNRFTDGSPLPLCSATVGTTRYAFVWTGYHWAVYGPATTQVQPVHTTPAPNLPAMASLPSGRWLSSVYYKYGTHWYMQSTMVALNSAQAQKLITDNGGGIVSHDSGTLLATSGSNLVVMKLIGSDSAGVVGPAAGSIIYTNPALIPASSLVTLSKLTTGHKSGDSLTYYQYNGNWYNAQVIAAGGGNVIAAGGGNIIAHDDHGTYYLLKVIAAGGGNIIAANPNLLNNQNILNNQHAPTNIRR